MSVSLNLCKHRYRWILSACQPGFFQRPSYGVPGFPTSGPTLRPAVARRRDVTGSEAWDRLSEGKPLPHRQAPRPVLALQLFVGLVGEGPCWGASVVTPSTHLPLRPPAPAASAPPPRRAARRATLVRLPVLLTAGQCSHSSRCPPRPQSRPTGRPGG